MKLMGRKRIVTLARSMVIRVSLSTADDSFIPIRLKF